MIIVVWSDCLFWSDLTHGPHLYFHVGVQSCHFVPVMMLYSLAVPHFPFIGCTVLQISMKLNTQWKPSLLQLSICLCRRQLSSWSLIVLADFPSYYSRAVASSKAEPEALLTKRPRLSHSWSLFWSTVWHTALWQILSLLMSLSAVLGNKGLQIFPEVNSSKPSINLFTLLKGPMLASKPHSCFLCGCGKY